jgi:hypothetical protein
MDGRGSVKNLSEHSVQKGITFEEYRWAPAPIALQTGPVMFSMDSGEKRTVQAGRRRKTSEPGPEGRERAEAPQRKPTGGGAGPRPPSGGTGGPGIPGYPSGGKPRLSLVGIIIVILLAICSAPVLLLQDSGDSGEPAQVLSTFEDQPQDQPTLPPRPTRTRAAAAASSATQTPRPAAPAGTSGQTWLVMLYQDADDKILEQDIYVDLNEAERAGSGDRVQIVAQVDRYRAGYSGDGNWTNTRRFNITQDDDLQSVGSDQVEDLGEANMADGETLVDFATWAIQNYPADRYILILSDHGMGWPGGWSDPTASSQSIRNFPLSTALGDQLYLMELDKALEDIRTQTGLDKFEIIGLDACLMGQLEVLTSLAPHGRYAVVSEETEPSLGWAYTSFLNQLLANPDISGAELSAAIVESYIQDDQRIQDDEARAGFLSQGSPLGGLFGVPSARQLARQLEQGVTLTAVDLEAISGVNQSVNSLALALQESEQKPIAQARTYAQSFTSIFGSEVPPSYIDLGNFVQFLKRTSNNREVTQAADQVLASLEQAVIAEKHGEGKPGASGISIYFPNTQLFRNPASGPESYTVAANRFASQSLWDDFLVFHYTGRDFDAGAAAPAVPQRGERVRAPVSSDVEVSPITLSARTAAPGRPVTLSADIQGENIGYIKLFVGFYDQASNSIFVADSDYLESPETRQVGGVPYPDWGEGEFTLSFEWEPVVFAINDGSNSAVALFSPQDYGFSAEQATYTVEGLYTFADGGETLNARLYFRDKQLRQVFGFTGEGETGAPREIVPQSGDRVTILERWMDLDQNGNVVRTAVQEGETLTFGDQMFTWEDLDAAAGVYIVGFIVEDLDGNAYPTFTQVTVR